MPSFSVWAPVASTVDLVRGGRRVRLQPQSRGWHGSIEAGPAAGEDYQLSLDGGPPLPDPRSPRQPRGVHGPSRAVDHTFDWTDQGWTGRPLSDCVLYELHCGTFSEAGTFDGAIGHLDHLVELGIGAVEVMPVAAFPGARGWGYDGVDLFAVHEAYGGPAALKRFVDACHSAGLAVIMDVVYNHLGPDGNYLGQFGPYFTDRYRTPWGDAVNYDDAGSDEVRRFVVDNALMWLRDYHCDGLRLDAVHAIHDSSATPLLEEISTAVHRLAEQVGRPLCVVAESDLNDPRVVRSAMSGGLGCDAQWSDDFHHALHAALTGERDGYYADFGRVEDVALALRNVFVNPGGYSGFRDRRHGRPVGGLPGTRFLGYMQNHDQVGNRAVGERSAALMSSGRLRIAAALVLLGPFVPLLFQGEEWAASTPFQYFTDHQDAELGRLVCEGRRREFGAFGWDPSSIPDPQAEDTFAQSRLRWDEIADEPHGSLLRWHRDLIALRMSDPQLRDGDRQRLTVAFDEGARWLLMSRPGTAVAVNWGDQEATLPVPAGHRVVLGEAVAVTADGPLLLSPDGAAVLRASGG